MDRVLPDPDPPAAEPSAETRIIMEGRALGAAIAALAAICVLAFVLGLLAGRTLPAQHLAPPTDPWPVPAGVSRVRLIHPRSGTLPARVHQAHDRRVLNSRIAIGQGV